MGEDDFLYRDAAPTGLSMIFTVPGALPQAILVLALRADDHALLEAPALSDNSIPGPSGRRLVSRV